MVLDPISLGVGAGAAIGSDAISYYANKSLARQAQANTQKNMRLQVELEDQSQANRILRYPQLLKRAGINPALAMNSVSQLGAATASHGETPAHMESESLANSLLAGKQLEMQDAETERLEAEARKANAEAETSEIQNKHAVARDNALNVSARNMLEQMRDSTDNPYMRGFLEEFLDSNSEIDLGAFTAFSELWFGLSQKERDRELDYLSKEFDKKVLRLQFTNGAAHALADMPKAQRYQIYRNMALMNAQIGQLNAETSLTEDKRNAIKANIEKLGQETLSILHHDPAAMWNAGELSSLGVMLGYESFKDFAHGAGMASGYAVGGAVGSRVAGQGTRAIGSAASSLGSGTLKTASKPKGMMPEVYANVVKRADELSHGDPVKKAQYINMLVRHWHDKYDK